MSTKAKGNIIGYRYYLGFHICLCYGPIDAIYEIAFDKRKAWDGVWTEDDINITAEYLYGGEDREGGVSGVIWLHQGYPDQDLSGYPIANVYDPLPGFRGVVSLFAERFYFGNNPYLKPFEVRLQRIHKTSDGATQWYDEKAQIETQSVGGSSEAQIGLFLHKTIFTGNEWAVTGDSSAFIFRGSHVASAISSTSSLSGNYFHTDLNPVPAVISNANAEFRINYLGTLNAGAYLQLSSLVSFQPDLYPDNLPAFTWAGGGAIHIIGDERLDRDQWYRIEIDFFSDHFNYRLRRGSSGSIILSGTVGAPWLYSTHPSTVGLFINNAGNTDRNEVEWRLIDIYATGGTSDSFGDMNPAHITRETITDDRYGMGHSTDDVNDDSFITAADTLYNEGLGLSFYWNRTTTIDKFREEIMRHIAGHTYVSRTTGKWNIKLIRDDYSISDILHLNEDNILKVSDIGTPAIGELTTSLTVQYYDRLRKKNGSLVIQDPALAQIQGKNVAQKVEYPGIASFALAARVGARDFRVMSSPLLSVSMETNREAANLNRGDPFLWSWPIDGIQNVVMRVVTIDFGNDENNAIKIQATQDVFTMPEVAFVVLPEQDFDLPTDGDPEVSTIRLVQETPYLGLVAEFGQTDADSQLDADPVIGYLAAGAARPSPISIAAEGIVNPGAGYEDPFSIQSYFGYAVLDTAISYLTDTVTAAVHQDLTFDNDQNLPSLNLPRLGSIEDEIVQVTDITASGGVLTITMDRAVLDTVPRKHAAGSYLLLWGADVYSDLVQYFDTETILVKILPIMFGQRLDPALAPEDSLTFNHRAIRPYPPGNVTLEGLRYPENVLVGPLTLDWSHRDRLQQTTTPAIDQYEDDIGPESATVTYSIYVYDAADNLVDQIDDLSEGPYIVFPPTVPYADYAAIELSSWRQDGTSTDAYESWQRHRIEFFWLDMLGSTSSTTSTGATTTTTTTTTTTSEPDLYYDAVVAAGPTAYWRFDELSGTTMYDDGGLYDGTYTGAVTLGLGGALSNGTGVLFKDNAYSTVPHDNSLNPNSGEFAVEFVLNFGSEITGVAFQKFQLNYEGIYIAVNSTLSNVITNRPGGILFGTSNTDTTEVNTIAVTYNDREWHHIVCQRRLVSTGPDVWKLEIYIDGTLENDKTLVAVPVNINNTSNISVGSASVRQIRAQYDELAYYVGKSLTTAQIAEHAALLNPSAYQPLDDYFEAVMADKPACYWRLNETSGSNFYDSAGVFIGTINGATLGATGATTFGTALSWDGVNDYCTIEDKFSDGMNPRTGEYAVEFFCKWTASTVAHIFSKTNSGAAGFQIIANFNGTGAAAGKICIRNSSAAAESLGSTSATLNDGSYHHVLLQRRLDGSQWKLEIYIDGSFDSSKNLSSAIDILQVSQVTYVGSFNNGTITQFLNITMDEIAFYLHSLTSTQVAAHYAARNT